MCDGKQLAHYKHRVHLKQRMIGKRDVKIKKLEEVIQNLIQDRAKESAEYLEVLAYYDMRHEQMKKRLAEYEEGD